MRQRCGKSRGENVDCQIIFHQLLLTMCAVITDPNDPKFDLEAYITQVQKDTP